MNHEKTACLVFVKANFRLKKTKNEYNSQNVHQQYHKQSKHSCRRTSKSSKNLLFQNLPRDERDTNK
jgi:hypothetical protein